MRKNPRRILSPQRLPFRHPGSGTTKLANRATECNSGGTAGNRRYDQFHPRICGVKHFSRTGLSIRTPSNGSPIDFETVTAQLKPCPEEKQESLLPHKRVWT